MFRYVARNVRAQLRSACQGSTHGRVASARERAKNTPTLKDLDFLELHPNGICLEKSTYDALMRTLKYASDLR